MQATDDVGTLWGSALLAFGFAVLGAFLVPASDTWSARLIAGVGAAVIALIAVWGVLLVYRAVNYVKRGDPVWRVAWSLSERVVNNWATVRVNGVSLVCDGHPSVDVSTLGHVEAAVRLPDGTIRSMAQEGMGGNGTTVGFAPSFTSGPLPTGAYEVRWYGTTHRRRAR